MAIDMVHFILQLLIAGFILRFVQVKLLAKGSDIGKALAFVY